MSLGYMNTPAKKIGAVLIGMFVIVIPSSYLMYNNHLNKIAKIQKEQERLHQEQEKARLLAEHEKRHTIIQNVIKDMMNVCDFSGHNVLTGDERKEFEACGDDLEKARKLIKEAVHLRIAYWGYQRRDVDDRGKRLLDYRKRNIASYDWTQDNESTFRGVAKKIYEEMEEYDNQRKRWIQTQKEIDGFVIDSELLINNK